MTAMLEWIESYVKAIVDKPEAVSLRTEEGVAVIIVTLSVAPEDHNAFAGRNNRLTRALGSVLGLAGAKSRKRYVLKTAS